MMERIKNKITLLNMVSSLILQIITLINGFIVPRIILTYFGSSINGLISSVNQFLNYIALVEGGLTGVVVASLYKPIVSNDMKKVSSILKTSSSFYKKICSIFIIYTIILAVFYPIIFKVNLPYFFTFSLIIILSLSLFIQYMFSLSLRNLLTADKKVFIISITQSLILIFNIIISYISVKIYPSIHLLKLLSGLLFIIQPIVFGNYINKNYNLDKNAKEEDSLIKSRWDGFAINIAAFIHFGTDIVLLTIFTNFKIVSVYSVYALVSNGLRQIINSITTGINPTIGNLYAKKDKRVNKIMDVYEYIVLILVFFLFGVGILLITPFVLIYTSNVTDVSYNRPLFGVLILISEALYLLKLPHLSLAYSANHFKQIKNPAYIEAGINIIISLLLVTFFGLEGVAIGTIIAMMYRLVFHIYYSDKLLPERNNKIYYCKIVIFTISALFAIFICKQIPFSLIGIKRWVICAIIYSSIFIITFIIISLLFFKKELIFFKDYLLRRKDKRYEKARG